MKSFHSVLHSPWKNKCQSGTFVIEIFRPDLLSLSSSMDKNADVTGYFYHVGKMVAIKSSWYLRCWVHLPSMLPLFLCSFLFTSLSPLCGHVAKLN